MDNIVFLALLPTTKIIRLLDHAHQLTVALNRMQKHIYLQKRKTRKHAVIFAVPTFVGNLWI